MMVSILFNALFLLLISQSISQSINAFPVPICDFSPQSINQLESLGYQPFNQSIHQPFVLYIRAFTNNTIPPIRSSSTGGSIDQSTSLSSSQSTNQSSTSQSTSQSTGQSTGQSTSQSTGQSTNQSTGQSSSSSSFVTSQSTNQPTNQPSSSSSSVSSQPIDQSSSSSIDQSTSQSTNQPSTNQPSSSSLFTGLSSSQSINQPTSSSISQSTSSGQALRRLLGIEQSIDQSTDQPINNNGQYYANNQSFVVTFDFNESINQSINQSFTMIGFLIYAVSFTPYQQGRFSIYQSINPSIIPEPLDSKKCFHHGMMDGFDQSINQSINRSISLPFSLFFDSPDVQSAGNVSINALVLFQSTNQSINQTTVQSINQPINQYYAILPSLTLQPQSMTEFSKPSTNHVRLTAIYIGGGTAKFTVEFDPSITNQPIDQSTDQSIDSGDGGAFVNQFVAYLKECDACPPRDYQHRLIDASTYPCSALFEFSESMLIDEFYILEINVVNAAGYQSINPFQYTFKNSKRTQIGTAPVQSSINQSINAGGVFGIIIGIIAFGGVVYAVTRFYQRKGQFRKHAQRIEQDHDQSINQPINQSDDQSINEEEEEETDAELEKQVLQATQQEDEDEKAQR